jgi:hypothetical protein
LLSALALPLLRPPLPAPAVAAVGCQRQPLSPQPQTAVPCSCRRNHVMFKILHSK